MSTTANILDPIKPSLDPLVWEKPADSHPVLRGEHVHWIKSTIYEALDLAGYSDPHKWLKLVLTGSLTTYQYSDDSDCDVSLFVDSKALPEWSRAEMIGIMVGDVDGTTLPGTPHPMQCFVVGNLVKPHDLFKPGLRSGYDLDINKWIVPPERARIHDVKHEQGGFYSWALQMADKMERLLRYEPDKAVDFWHQIHSKRRRDQQTGKGDYSESNIIYKFLANRGLMPKLEEASGEYIAKTTFTQFSQKVFDATLKDEGITISISGVEPTTGYVFSPSLATQEKVPLSEFSPYHVDKYMAQHKPELEEPAMYLGTWISGDQVYLDVVENHSDREEAFKRAWDAHQLEMWDVENKQAIPVRGSDYVQPTLS